MKQHPKPLKRFGQNYLVDQNIVKKIISEFAPTHENVIIEIGPGRGVLTEQLNKTGATVYAVEIDKRVIDELKEKFQNVQFINKDFLKINLDEFGNEKKLRIIGNIPYNITSPILFKLIDNLDSVSDALFMVQFEVAQRIIAKPRTKEYGILSVILNHFFNVELCFKVPPTVFYPKPKVDSAIIKLTANRIKESFDNKLFINTVKGAFGNRRKNLKNSYSNSILSAYKFDSFPVELTKRAEELIISDYLKIYEFFKKQIND
ncbi:MAG: 16S rRNA (adenine(1518)-N(6)/adenine(1519)-N(6))-dimethyltransferase RsmA [Melioribacteraceae bacterium]|nr:MAG: 16S rRNA (adenine(1518)-N(6)/adenine(1519)-N(6))-dimethyltransferase RsmA [Melioribacteraceae bacterium]